MDTTSEAIAKLDAAQAAFDKSTPSHLVQPWSEEIVKFLSLSVLIFTCIVLLLSTLLLLRSGALPRQILKVFGIILIIGFSALLLVVGYSNEQLTPIVGLFGAIAGYLLGKDSPTSASRTN
jgi:hypothetical protein